MGNISDALEKSGVELASKEAEIVKEQPLPVKKPQESPKPKPKHTSSSEPWDERLTKVTQATNGASEAFRVLRSRILYPQDEKKRPQTIMVTASAPQEGKSFVSANLAATMARGLDQYSLLVDCDLRRPSAAKMFGLEVVCKKGLTDYLRGDGELSELIHKTSVQKLSILASGNLPVNPAELLTSARMSSLVAELSGRYSDRFIIFDSPPYQIASESNVLAKAVDGVIIVVGYGKSDKSQVKNMVEQIGRDKIIGVVFNGVKSNFIQNKLLSSYGNYGGYYKVDDK